MFSHLNCLLTSLYWHKSKLYLQLCLNAGNLHEIKHFHAVCFTILDKPLLWKLVLRRRYLSHVRICYLSESACHNAISLWDRCALGLHVYVCLSVILWSNWWIFTFTVNILQSQANRRFTPYFRLAYNCILDKPKALTVKRERQWSHLMQSFLITYNNGSQRTVQFFYSIIQGYS
jgi:hypothetical protein